MITDIWFYIVAAVVFIFVVVFVYDEDYVSDIIVSCPVPNVSVECPTLPDLSCPKVDFPECPDCQCAQCYVIDDAYESHLQMIVSSVSQERSYDYDDDRWNCDEMSTELVDRLRNAGYSCRMRCGFYTKYSNERHCWVSCDDILIEATDGTIVSVNDYQYYKS